MNASVLSKFSFRVKKCRNWLGHFSFYEGWDPGQVNLPPKISVPTSIKWKGFQVPVRSECIACRCQICQQDNFLYHPVLLIEKQVTKFGKITHLAPSSNKNLICSNSLVCSNIYTTIYQIYQQSCNVLRKMWDRVSCLRIMKKQFRRHNVMWKRVWKEVNSFHWDLDWCCVVRLYQMWAHKESCLYSTTVFLPPNTYLLSSVHIHPVLHFSPISSYPPSSHSCTLVNAHTGTPTLKAT